MNISAEKQNIVQWIKGINDEKVIQKILEFKSENEDSFFENNLIQKGLDDILEGNTSSHEDVKKRFSDKFAKK